MHVTHIRYGTPGGFVPLGVLIHPVHGARVKEGDFADSAVLDDLAGCMVTRLRLEVLRDAPDEALGLVRGLVLCDEGAALRDVGRDGLLAEDVLAGGERLADHGGLGGDREDDDDAVDVGAGEEGVERLGGVLVVVDVGLVGEAEGLLCGLGKGGGALD